VDSKLSNVCHSNAVSCCLIESDHRKANFISFVPPKFRDHPSKNINPGRRLDMMVVTPEDAWVILRQLCRNLS
jgi:hypothetical protein